MSRDFSPHDDFQLKPIDCPSQADWERALTRRELPSPDPLEPPPKRQYSIVELFVLTFGCALGFAGGSWMPRAAYAAVLGLTILFGMILVPWLSRLPEVIQRRIWLAMLSAYAAAIAAVALRS